MAGKKAVNQTTHRCRDCKHSYDWHEIAMDTGQPFMCRCSYYTDGKYCKFLNDYTCEHFEMK